MTLLPNLLINKLIMHILLNIVYFGYYNGCIIIYVVNLSGVRIYFLLIFFIK